MVLLGNTDSHTNINNVKLCMNDRLIFFQKEFRRTSCLHFSIMSDTIILNLKCCSIKSLHFG